MFEKFRKSLKARRKEDSQIKVKTIVAYVLFGAIILVFAFFGITPERMGSDLGGNAAVVNGQAISVASFRRQLDMVTRNSNFNLDQFPAAQREFFTKELSRRTLEEMIMMEGLFQTAEKIGLRVADGEVRNAITSIPFFQEDGKFQRANYTGYLQATAQSATEFERQVRKELMAQKLQGLFAGSHQFSKELDDGLRSLNQVSLGFRYASLNAKELADKAQITSARISEALSSDASAIQAEYEARKIDYYSPEKVKARHILVKVGDGQTRDQASEKVKQLKAELNVENFSELARKHSDDPGSKTKGGDLGFFEKGQMVPPFEQAAFSLTPNQISEPVETDFGFHIILVDEKQPGGQKTFEEVKEDVAKRFLARKWVNDKLDEVKNLLKEGEKAKAVTAINQLGVKWEKVDNVTLGADALPGFAEDSSEVLRLLSSRRGELGIVPEIKEWRGGSYLFDLTSWKSQDVSKDAKEQKGAENEAGRLANESFQKWVMSLNESLRVERNSRLLQ